MPFAYGGLGACTYLLVSCHHYLVERTFQRINISSAALAFIAGYNVDFLFKTMERLMEVILPKVGLDSVARAQATTALQAKPIDLEQLIRQLNDAPDEKTREAIAILIDRLTRP